MSPGGSGVVVGGGALGLVWGVLGGFVSSFLCVMIPNGHMSRRGGAAVLP